MSFSSEAEAKPVSIEELRSIRTRTEGTLRTLQRSFEVAAVLGVDDLKVLRMSLQNLHHKRALRNHLEAALICEAKGCLDQL